MSGIVLLVHLTEEYRKMSLRIADIMAYKCRLALSRSIDTWCRI